jgi:AcrR family transcriptional regulator
MLRLSTLGASLAEVPSRAYHHGNLRRALIDGAVALFAQRGTFDFTFRELAREAGVTHNAPYRHFSGKADLLDAVRAEGFADLARACHAALSRASDDPRDRVRALGGAYVRFAIAHPHHFRLMLHNPFEGETPEKNREAFQLLHDVIDEGRAKGALRADLTARELALAAWSLVHGFSSLMVAGQLSEAEGRTRKYMRVLDAVFFDGASRRAARKSGTLRSA